MSATAVGLTDERATRFYDSTVGKKVVMAVSGVALFGFVLVHMVGNLQFFEGSEKMAAYGRFLRVEPTLLWAARIGLLTMVVAHIWSAVSLALIKNAARPQAYVKKKAIKSTYASRTMYWSGPIVLAFIIYHLLDLTFGAMDPGHVEGAIYENMVRSFSHPLVSGFYVLSIGLLCTHLNHGIWSMFQTLGVGSPRYTPLLKTVAALLSIAIFLGFISIPLSVAFGFKS
jgi:succinate dehydrogenase / fumarate reductase cytochrome b subunit